MEIALFVVLDCEDITEKDIRNAKHVFLNEDQAVAFASSRIENEFIWETTVTMSPENFTR